MCVLGGMLLAESLTGLDHIVADSVADSGGVEELFGATAESVQNVTSVVAGALLTFMGVVFSLTLVALQMASGQYSPRVMRTFVRNRTTKWTMGAFMGTFTFSIMLLANIEPGNDRVEAYLPALGFATLMLLVVTCLFMFVRYVHAVVRLLRIGHIVDSIAEATECSVRHQARQADARPFDADLPLSAPAPVTVAARRSGTVVTVDIRRVARAASAAGARVQLLHRPGSYVSRGERIALIHGSEAADPTRLVAAVESGIVVDKERTMLDDPAFGLRQLVDIAVRALPPNANDPTTAVQALDRITTCLLAIGGAPDPPEHFSWAGSTIRVSRPVLGWAQTLDLACAEIRSCGRDSVQVSRRMTAMFDTLTATLPSDRIGPVAHQRELLRDATSGAELRDGDAVLAGVADSSGLG